MPVEKESKFSEFMAALRQEGLPAIKLRVMAWFEACREEPRLIWRTTAVRVGVYLIAGLILVQLVGWGFSLMAPAKHQVQDEATTADFHVVCTNSDCGHHFVINRKFGFDDFPVTCPKCGKNTGAHARKCVSDTCKGRWVAPDKRTGGLFCPVCDSRLGAGD